MVTYKKLRDGSWGLQGLPEELIAGVKVQVRTKAGEVKTEIVGRIIWQDDKVAIATKQESQSSKGRGLGRRTGCSCGSREGGIQETDCWSCKHDAE